MIEPTPRQLELLRFIAGYLEAHAGVSPSFRDMQAGVAARSKRSVFNLLAGLERRGLIRRLPNRERAIELLADVRVPRAPDGAPLFAVRGDARWTN